VLLIVLSLAACGGSGGQKIDESALSALVLQQQDLPRGYSRVAGEQQGRAGIPSGPREDPTRFGRLGGRVARFRGDATAVREHSPLVIESRADVFKSTGGAKKDLSAYNDEYSATASTLGGTPVETPRIGDDSLAFRFGSGSDRSVLVAFRRANATGSVLVEGSSITVGDAYRLAWQQQQRIAAQAT